MITITIYYDHIIINIIVLFHMLDFTDRIRDITAPVGLFAVGSPVC